MLSQAPKKSLPLSISSRLSEKLRSQVDRVPARSKQTLPVLQTLVFEPAFALLPEATFTSGLLLNPCCPPTMRRRRWKRAYWRRRTRGRAPGRSPAWSRCGNLRVQGTLPELRQFLPPLPPTLTGLDPLSSLRRGCGRLFHQRRQKSRWFR